MSTKLEVIKDANLDIVEICPELLVVADTYLRNGNIDETASALRLDRAKVTQILAKREVRAYVDSIYMDYGYRNRFKLAGALDALIDKKLEELQEADIGSSKDIAELLQMAHKMRMDEIGAQTKLLEARNKHEVIKNQTNIQVNQGPTGNYADLLNKLMNNNNI
jgi:hypothetical protein